MSEFQLAICGLIYTINKDNKTAQIKGFQNANDDLFIPRSVNHESQEYIVTSILKEAFKLSKQIRSIRFDADSELISIGKEAFSYSSIESIYIPASLIYLHPEWCNCTKQLANISVSQNNPYYKSYDNKFILKKSSVESDSYDFLVFCSRNLEAVTIPNFVTIIGPFAFHGSEKLRQVFFENGSKLQIIEQSAFAWTSLESIKIPRSVKQIKEKSFSCCTSLRFFELPFNSDLEFIGQNAFTSTAIEKIIIPANVKKIYNNTFEYCQNLLKIEIQSNSKLEAIESDAFATSSIESISIPSSLIGLQDGWCNDTPKLNKIFVNEGNPLFKTYEDKFILKKSSLEKEDFNFLVFCVRNIEKLTIPNFIEVIGPFSFHGCEKFQSVEFQSNSKIRLIESMAFSFTLIKSIEIPSSVTKICDGAFYGCKKLHHVEYQHKSDLQIIEKDAFCDSVIDSMFFPSHLEKVDKDAFLCCHHLQIIELDENSKLTKNDLYFINYHKKVLIMIPFKSNEQF